MADTITQTMLNKRYGTWGTTILSEHLRQQNQKRGKVRTYAIVKELPNEIAYAEMQRRRFTSSLASQISDAFSDLSSLHDELDDWYNNLPESFQSGDKGSQLEEAIGVLDGVSEPSVADALAEIQVYYIPQHGASRADRCSNAVGILRACIEELEALAEDDERLEDARTLAEELDSAASEAESVEFPGMY